MLFYSAALYFLCTIDNAMDQPNPEEPPEQVNTICSDIHHFSEFPNG